jgi:hypothetical protein
MSRRPGKKNGVPALLSKRSAKQRHSIGIKDGSIIAAIITRNQVVPERPPGPGRTQELQSELLAAGIPL